MNPDTNKFEKLIFERSVSQAEERSFRQQYEGNPAEVTLFRPDGSPVPRHWSVFRVDEDVIIKGYTFTVRYVGETSILFEPKGPIVLGGGDD